MQPLKGSYTVICEGQTTSAGAGETIVVPANATVTFIHHGTKLLPMQARWLHINWELFNMTDLTNLIQIPLKITGGAGIRFGAIIEEALRLTSQPDKENLFSAARQNELGFRALWLVLEKSRLKKNVGEYIGGIERLRKVLTYMQTHLQTPTTIATLAAVQCISPSRFFTVFKNHIGMSPMLYLRKLRLEEACRLLLSTDLSISRITVETGFINQFHFSRIFKESTGLSPRDYRKRLF
ncbi:MAG: AraC family transcriptional regulator [Chitinivibrionales bacterium]|nr:AraC family transcriptional regulator [Chitinivibrionales bacterium]